jgi:hypothetical protein
MSGSDPLPGPDHFVSGHHVLSCTPNVIPGFGLDQNANPVAMGLGVLLPDDTVGTGRHGGTGEDASRNARIELGRRRITRWDLESDRKTCFGPGRSIRSPQGVTIHGRTVARGNHPRTGDLLGQHPSQSRIGCHGF